MIYSRVSSPAPRSARRIEQHEIGPVTHIFMA
jgi:hypothetical protein